MERVMTVEVLRQGTQWVVEFDEVDADGAKVIPDPVKASSMPDLVYRVHSVVDSHAGQPVPIEFIWPWAEALSAVDAEVADARVALEQAMKGLGEVVGNMAAAKVSPGDISRMTGMSVAEVKAILPKRKR